MSSPWDALEQALQNQWTLNHAIERNSTALAKALDGNLSHVTNGYVLARMKKQLESFDSRSKEWKR
jgi:hypothetical protein